MLRYFKNRKQDLKTLFASFACLFLLSFLCLPELQASENSAPISPKESKWHSEFIHRNRHHISLLGGFFASRWNYPDKRTIRQHFLEKTLNYTYHMKLFYSFSLFLGSSLGYAFDLKSEDKFMSFSDGKIILPGFLLGFSYSFSTRFKVNLGTNFSWSRSFGVVYKGSQYQFNMRTVPNISLGFDYFFTQNWAITSSLNYKQEFFSIKSEKIKENLSPLYGFSRESLGLLLGITFHKL